MALYRSPDYKTSFESADLPVQEKKFKIDFQDGGHHENVFLILLLNQKAS